MKVRQILVACLMALGGAFLTWATASALEQYMTDKHDRETVVAAPYNPGKEPRRTF